MDLETEITSIKNDIVGLETELLPLQAEHDALFRQVAHFEAENKHKHLAKPSLPQKNDDHEDDAPALIHYSYFDDSIKQYFGDSAETQDPLPSRDDLFRIEEKAKGGHLALLESIHRFGGITAFPINDRLYDSLDDALLGLRFDVLAHTTKQYLKPHYIILRRRPTKDNLESHWLVFRYTTPAYVPLDKYSKHLDESLQVFVEKVRACLISIQYKHDKIDSLEKLTFAQLGRGSGAPIVSRLDKDLECRRVTITVKAPSRLLEIELTCGLSRVENALCRFSSKQEQLYVEDVLTNCDFKKLQSTFLKVFQFMLEHSLI